MMTLSFYQRSYTALPGLQKARQVVYALTVRRTPSGFCYGIRVTEPQSNTDERCQFTYCRARAEDMLKYLYENAVPPAQCISVIADACTAMQWEGNDATSPDPSFDCG